VLFLFIETMMAQPSFRKYAKEIIFIHDYFNFVIYENQTLNQISLDDIAHYTNDEENQLENQGVKTPKKSSTLLSLAKKYIMNHIKNKREPPTEDLTSEKLFPLEYNLIPLICFISLKIMHQPILPKDIIRWIKSGHLPYLTAFKDSNFEGL
jgi:hypothetical protein